MCPEVMSFDEMLYAPPFNGLAPQRFDNVLIDEAQDSSVPRILLAERMLAERGRLFAVGDRYQSIYGFAGADASAMANIVKRFDATVLPLSVSFRCASLAFEFLRNGVPCRMAGRLDLGGSLKKLAHRGDVRTLDALETRLNDWLQDEIKLAALRDKPERANAAHDIVETMRVDQRSLSRAGRACGR